MDLLPFRPLNCSPYPFHTHTHTHTLSLSLSLVLFMVDFVYANFILNLCVLLFSCGFKIPSRSLFCVLKIFLEHRQLQQLGVIYMAER